MSSFDDVRVKLEKIQNLVNIGKGIADKDYMSRVVTVLQDPQFQNIKFKDLIAEHSKQYMPSDQKTNSKNKNKRPKSALKFDTSSQFSQQTPDKSKSAQKQHKNRFDHFMDQLLKQEDQRQVNRPRSISPNKEQIHNRSLSRMNGDFGRQHLLLLEIDNVNQVQNNEEDIELKKQALKEFNERQIIIQKMLEIGGMPLIKFVDFLGKYYLDVFDDVKQKYQQEKQKLEFAGIKKQKNLLADFIPSQKAVHNFLEGQKQLTTLIKQKKMLQHQKDIAFLRIILLLLNYTATEDDSVLPYKAIHILQQTKLKHPYQQNKTIEQMEKQLFAKQISVQQRSLLVYEYNNTRLMKLLKFLFNEEKYITQIQCISKMNLIVQEISKYLGVGIQAVQNFSNNSQKSPQKK